MRATIRTIATAAIIAAIALTLTACDDIETTGSAIEWTNAERRERVEQIHGPITDGPAVTFTTEERHTNWIKREREVQHSDAPAVDLSEIFERNGYNK